MKRKNIIIMAITFIFVALFIPVAFAEVDINFRIADAEEISPLIKEISQSFEEEQVPIKFAEAVRKGNLETVKDLIKKYPKLGLLTTQIADENGNKTLPVCVAAANGYSQIVAYFIGYESDQLRVSCGKNNTPIDIAVANGHAHLVAFLAKNIEKSRQEKHHLGWVLIKAVKPIKDENSLKELIPSLLDAGATYSDIELYKNKKDPVSDIYDVFYYAAREENPAFVTTLRDEIIKRGETPISYYTLNLCSDSYSLAWGISQSQINKRKQEYIDRVNNSEEVSFLKENGIGFKLSVRSVYDDSCE